MKKILSFILIAVLCLGVLTGCDVLGNIFGNDNGNDNQNITYNLPAAKEFLVTKTNVGDSKNDAGVIITQFDYEVLGQVMIAGIKYTVDWTVDSDKVKLVDNDTSWTVDVFSETEEAYDYTLTATITAGDGTTITATFTRHVQIYKVLSFEEYMAAQKGDIVTIEGIVVAINAQKNNNKYNHVFVADAEGKGGYYCYSVVDDPALQGIKPGMTVSVTGTCEPYSGMQEIKGGKVSIVDSSIKSVPTVDLTEKFAAGESLVNYVGLPVIFKGVTIGGQELEKETSQYLHFELNGQKSYMRTYVSDFINLDIQLNDGVYSSADKAVIDEAHAAKFGWTANAQGILILYNGNPYLIPMGLDCFEYLEFVEKTEDEKIAAEKELLTAPENVTEDTVIELPLAGKNYTDVTITWTVDNDNYTITEDGKLEVKLTDEKVTLTLTATLTCGAKSDTVTFTIKVKALSKGTYMGEHVDSPVAGTGYKFYLTAKDGLAYYFNGLISGNYLQTSTNIADAVDVYLEAAEGGFYFYFMDGETKTYIDLNDSGKIILSTSNPAAIFSYVAETNIWTADIGGTGYYLGTYSNYTTVSASKNSYINAENTGVSQFPAGFAIAIPATQVPENTNTPVAGTGYKFYLTAKDGLTYYFNGLISGNYLQTSTNIADAVDVFVESVEGGFLFYFMDGENKTYIDLNDSGKIILSTSNPAAIFNYVAETNIWTANIGGTDYYLGTYSNYTTVSASKNSYINAENTGVSQFPAGFATTTLAPIGPADVTDVAANTAYKFYLTAKDGLKYYFNGLISGNYLQTTTDLYSAIDVFVESVEGGFLFYFMDGETKTYIDLNTSGKIILSTSNPAAIFNYVAETNIWTANIGGTDYYLGTYSNYTTVSASKNSYINAENTGVSQFPAGFATIEVIKDESGEEEEDKVVDTDPSNPVCSLPVANIRPDGADVVVTGTVTADDKNNSVTIKDENGATLYIYKLATPVAVGDVITVTGKMATYKESRQVAEGATAVINTAHTCEYDAATCLIAELCKHCGATKEGSTPSAHAWVDATCVAPKYCSVCFTVEGEAIAHTYGDDGKCVCGITNGQSIVVVNFAVFAGVNGWENSKMYNTVNADANITFSATSTNPEVQNGNNTGKYYVSGYNWRIYQADAPELKIAAAEGKTIKAIKVTYESQNDGTLAIGTAHVVSGELVEINANSVTLTVINNGNSTKTNGQARISSIEVIYE